MCLPTKEINLLGFRKLLYPTKLPGTQPCDVAVYEFKYLLILVRTYEELPNPFFLCMVLVKGDLYIAIGRGCGTSKIGLTMHCSRTFLGWSILHFAFMLPWFLSWRKDFPFVGTLHHFMLIHTISLCREIAHPVSICLTLTS